jgi:fucose permease
MILLYATMFLVGFMENIKGVSYPLIKNEFGVSYETQGTMISILSFSYTIFVVVAGFMLGRFGVKKIYVLGFIFLLLAASSLKLMSGFWTVTTSLFSLFAGIGVMEIAINAVATQVFLKRSALMMSLLHFMYGMGSIVSPKAAGILADPAGMGLPWRHVYLLTVPVILVIFIPMLFTKFPAQGQSGTKDGTAEDSQAAGNKASDGKAAVPQQKHSYIAALKTPSVWAFGIALGVMIGLEMAASNWGSLYFQDTYGMKPETSGANFVSVFFVSFTLSRLLSGFIIEKIGYMRSLIGAIVIGIVIFLVGFALGPKGIYILPLQGFLFAIFWPTVMAITIGYYGKNAPLMSSAVIAIAGLFNSAIQFVMGHINQHIGAAWGYRSCLVFAVILLCFLLILNRRLKHSSKVR